MLLKAGVAMIISSLALAAVVVTVIVLRADSPAEPIFSAEPQAAEVKQETEEPKFDPGEKLQIADDEPDEDPQPKPQAREPWSAPSLEQSPSGKSPSEEVSAEGLQSGEPLPSESRVERQLLREPATGESATGEWVTGESASVPEVPDWPQPTRDQAASARGPRYYKPTYDTDMFLTIKALGLYNVPVISSYGYESLDRGLMHEPDTSFPWDSGTQRNVYVAGHYLGWPGTASHLVFYNLDKLKSGDEILLKDSEGNAYRYLFSESFMAGPEESWVMGQIRGRDMLTLQTCIPPTFEDRLVLRADRI